jgi:tetratricopeptide (TPR) repeat protein
MSRRERSRGRELLQGTTAKSGEYKAVSRKSGRRTLLSRLSKWGPRRINRKAALTLLGIIAAVVVLYFPVRYYQESWLRRSALAQAREAFDAGNVDKALVAVEGYLATWPDDPAGLELRGELVWKTVTSVGQVQYAIKSLETLLSLDPDPPARQEDRKRLVELLIRFSDMVRASVEQSKDAKGQDRSLEAYKIAAERIKKGADDAESHRLLGMTLERIAESEGSVAVEDPKDPNKTHLVPAGPEAVKEFRLALRKDKTDFHSAERLAALRMKQSKKDQAGADAILNKLVSDSPRSVDARLVRAQHFLETGREKEATADVERAAVMESTNRKVRLMAASLAIRRGDGASARRHLAAIPKAEREDTRVDVLLSNIEFLERRPDRAIEKIRDGLSRYSGCDRELTWRLAYLLIQFGRATEARPLMDQYRRLVGTQDNARLLFLDGLLLEKAGQHASALIKLNKASDLVGSFDGEWKPELFVLRGRCQEALGNFDAAKVDYEEARSASPSSQSPRQALARLMLRTDSEHPDLAIAELEAGIRPPALPTASLYAELALAHLAQQVARPADARDWTAAKAALEKGLRIKADDTDLLRARVAVAAAEGRLDEAGSILEEATNSFGRSTEEVWLARSLFLERRGQIGEAISVLEQASNPGAAGDKAGLRSAKATLLARTGHGRASLNLLAVNVEKFATAERAILARDKADLLISLGDRKGARLACVEWAGLVPDDLAPGLKLVEMARQGGTEEELKAGVELLNKAVGDRKDKEPEPYALAAQALALLVPIGANKDVTSNLDLAESLSEQLQVVAPQLPVTLLIHGLIAEQNKEYEQAIADYKLAIKRDGTGLALPRLIALLTQEKRDEEVAALKKDKTASSTAIDRILVRENLGIGDKEHKEKAETLLASLVEAQPDSLEYRADFARLLRELGKPEEAEKTVRALCERQPDRPYAWLALLASQLERGDRAAASQTIERMKVSYKGERPELLLGRCLWAIGDRDAATKLCERELARKAEDIETIRLASEVHEANGRSDFAEALLVKVRKLDPNLAWARRRLALILSGRANHARWAEARALMEPSPGSAESPDDRLTRALVLERGPDPASRGEAIRVYRSLVEDLPITNRLGRRARLSLAQLLLNSKDAAGAAQAIAPATAESAFPDPASLAVAVEALTHDGKPEEVSEARRLLERLAEIQPNTPPTIACRALVLKAEGDLEGAAAALVEAAAAAEKTPEAQRLNRYYFDRLAQLGSDTAAEQLGRKMVERWPAEGTALARFLVVKNRLDESLDACRLAIEAGSVNEPLQFIQVLDVSGRFDETRAQKAGNLAISAALRTPKDGGALAMTAALLRHQRRFEDEVALYRKLLAADPANVVARNNLAWGLAHDLGKPAEALVEVDRVIKEVGPLPAAVDTRGMILGKLGRLSEAIADLERATRVDPSAVHQIHLARAYAQAGRLDDRRRAIELARMAAANPNALEPEDRAELDAVIH